MRSLSLLIVLAMMAGVTLAADKVVVPLSQTEGLLISAPGASSITTERISIQSIGTVTVTPGPITPGPVVPGPVVPGDLSSVVKLATTAVANYPDKDTHRRTLAAAMGLISQAIPSSDKSAEGAMTIVRTNCDAVIGSDAAQWSSWWDVVNAQTYNMTVGQYKTALRVIADAVVDGLASSELVAGEDIVAQVNERFASANPAVSANAATDIFKLMGVDLESTETYGLDISKWIDLIIKFLPVIMQLIALFTNLPV